MGADAQARHHDTRDDPSTERRPALAAIDQVVADLQTYRRVETLTDAAYAARLETSTAEAQLRHIDLTIERTHRTTGAFEARLTELYHDAGHARDAFRYLAETKGLETAERLLRQHPERLADLRSPDHPIGHATPEQRGMHLRDTAAMAATEGRLAYEAEDVARDTADAIHAQRLDTVFRRAVATLYDDPVQARARFMDEAADHGIHETAERLKHQPAAFGSLRSAAAEARGAPGVLDAETRTQAHLTADAGRAWADYELRMGSGTPHPPTLQAAYDRAERARTRFERTSADIYRAPHEVRHVFFAIADAEGLHRAAEQFRQGPYRFGLTHTTRIETAEGTQHVPVTIDPARLEIMVARGRADYCAHHELALTQAFHDQRGRGQAFRMALYELYERASEAWQRFATIVTTRGIEDAARRLRDHPHGYGRLRSPGAHQATAIEGILSATQTAAALGRAFYTNPRTLPTVREAAWQGVVQARAKEAMLRRTLATLPSTTVLQRRIGATMRQMMPAEVAQLNRLLTAPKMMLVRQFTAQARDMALTSERER